LVLISFVFFQIFLGTLTLHKIAVEGNMVCEKQYVFINRCALQNNPGIN